ncbi:MAG: Tim44-like domain-containing protein [Mariprofundus sp.]|nr:Tim44-like domain-containing protein [Mariprofundus sp.]
MKHFILLAVLAAFGLSMLGLADDADARRFGGGSSFGKQRMQSHTPSATKKATPQASQRGSARPGMMGMLGGLAMGGLLGALFFGGGFEGINFLDIVMIGGALALLFFFLRRRAQSAQANQSQPAYAGGEPSPQEQSHDFAINEDETDQSRPAAGTVLRPDINEKNFLPAAKEIYIRMQKAWDNGDSEDILKFCTPEVAQHIASDMKPGTENRTEVATLNATIHDTWIESDKEWVAVNFSAILREQTLDHSGTTVEDQSTEVNEIWIFQHTQHSDDPIWYLSGIQQPDS